MTGPGLVVAVELISDRPLRHPARVRGRPSTRAERHYSAGWSTSYERGVCGRGVSVKCRGAEGAPVRALWAESIWPELTTAGRLRPERAKGALSLAGSTCRETGQTKQDRVGSGWQSVYAREDGSRVWNESGASAIANQSELSSARVSATGWLASASVAEAQ